MKQKNINYLSNTIIKCHRSTAYTIVEFSLVVLIFGLMYGMATPIYVQYLNDAKTEEVEKAIVNISLDIDDFFYQNGHYPDSLEEVYGEVPLDEWGNPYQYLRIDGGAASGLGKLRKDKNLVPINTDYDLYSMGPDGESQPPLTANSSMDDIVRGRNGTYFGVAEEY